MVHFAIASLAKQGTHLKIVEGNVGGINVACRLRDSTPVYSKDSLGYVAGKASLQEWCLQTT